MMKLKGIVSFVVRDKDTGAIKRVQTEDNVITHVGLSLLNSGSQIPALSGGSTQRISISGRRVGSGDGFDPTVWHSFGILGATSPSGPIVQIVEKTGSTPYYVEYLNRFNPPATLDRTIWSISICYNFSNTTPATIAALASPCTQTTTEILDVYYRIQALEPAIDPYSFELPTTIDSAWASWISGLAAPSGLNSLSFRHAAGLTWGAYQAVPGKFYRRYTAPYPQVAGGSWSAQGGNLDYQRYGQYRWITPNTISQNVGRITRSMVTAHGFGDSNGYNSSLYINPAVPEGFEPVQPIHKHNSSATQPFLDVNTLASGTGTVNASGSSWHEENYPEYHRVDISDSGDIGTSRYTFGKRVITHLSSTGLNWHCWPMETLCLVTGYGLDGEITTFALGDALRRGSSDPANYFKPNNELYYQRHSNTSAHLFNSNSIQWFDLKRNIYRVWNVDDYPAFLATGLKQVSSDDSGYMWAACANTGLYKIWAQDFDITAVTPGAGGVWTVRGDATSFLSGGETIQIELNTGINTANTTYTVASVGAFAGGVTPITVSGGDVIPAGSNATGVLYIQKVQAITTPGAPADYTKCHGVSIGISDTIWALFTDGLGQSTDSGATWTIYHPGSGTPFSYAGITDSSANYATVQSMRVQKDSPATSARMAFVRAAGAVPTTAVTIVWWSLAGTAITGPVLSGIVPTAAKVYGMEAPGYFTVSETGGFWTAGGLSTAGYFYGKLMWGTPVQNRVGLTRSQFPSSLYSPIPGYFYDSYGQPYTTNNRNGDGSGSPPYVYDNTLNNYGRLQLMSNQTTDDLHHTLHLYKGMCFSGGLGGPSVYRNSTSLWMPDFDNTSSWNRKETMGQETVWDRYMWDTGAVAWKKEWHSDALDASGNAYDGTRRQFNVEDLTFTGRSTIQVPAVALSTNFTSHMTLSARVSPTVKLFTAGTINTGGQLLDQTVISYIDESDSSNFMHLNLYDENNLPGGSKIALHYKDEYFYFDTTTAGVDNGTDTITLNTSHSFADGNAVRYEKRRGKDASVIAAIGLTDYNIYFVRVTGLAADEIQLFPTAADAIANTNKINLTAAATTYEAVEYHFVKRMFLFGTGLATGSSYNVQLIIDGTGPSAAVYVDGVQSGSTVTLPSAPDFSPATGRLAVGGRWFHPEQEAFSTTDGMFRGTMENVLLDDTAWTGVEIAAYHASPLTYAGPGASTRVRYQLNEAFTGVATPGTSMLRETKATHVGYEDTYNGLQVKFTAGSPAAQSFIATDYYTFGVIKDGMLKDNAISFTWNGSVHIWPLDNNVTAFTPSAIPGVTTSATELVCYRNYGESNTVYMVPGAPTNRVAGVHHSFQSTTGDISYQWTMRNPIVAPVDGPTDTERLIMSVSDTLGTGNGKWQLRFDPDGTVDVWENGIEVSAAVDTYVYGDVFEIRRTGTTFTYYKNAGLIYTSGTTSSARVYCWKQMVSSENLVAGAFNATVAYDRPAYTVKIGSSGSFTGWFDPEFYNIDAVALDPSQVELDGTPATAITVAPLNTTIETVASPAAGEVTIVPDNGLLIFNSADAGKTVTGRFTTILKKP